jgi:hypothetical protein
MQTRRTLVLLLACAVAAQVGVPAASAAVRLNELMAGPASDWDQNGAFSSRDDEWIEIVNDGAAPVDLGAYLITDAGNTPRFRFSGTLDPGAYRLVYGSDAVAWERDNGQPVFGLSLGNTGDSAMLWEITASETLLVDEVTYTAHEAAADRAVGRLPDARGTWALFDALNPYVGSTDPQGNGCAPTPGTENVCDITPTAQTSWGRLKSIYR